MATSERDAARRSSHYLKYLVYYPRGGYILAGNEKTRPSFFEKKKKKRRRRSSNLLFFFLSFSFSSVQSSKFFSSSPRPLFSSADSRTLSLLERLYSSTSQYLSQCRVTEERINMYRETCCHFKARTAVAFILSSRRYVHEGNAPLGKVDTYVQWNSI